MTKTQSGFKKSGFGLVWLLTLYVLIGSGCGHSKEVMYFNDKSALKNGNTAEMIEFTSFKIKPDDILDITIQTLDPQNTQGITSSSGGTEKVGGASVAGFQVDKNGYIELPIVGRTMVEGLTLLEAKEKIRTQAKQYFKEPLVNIRLANFRVTVLGEVGAPGMVMVPVEKAGLLDVLGMVGDLTATANRQKIVLIREEGNTKKFVNLDITSAEIFKSPYYYVKPGDVIYAEPTKVKARSVSMDVTRDRYIGYALSLVAIAFNVISLIRISQQ